MVLDQKMIKKQEAQRKHLQAFVDRFRAKASKARQAQSRLKMLARMEPVAALTVNEVREIDFPAPDKLLSPPIIATDDVAVGYGERVVLSGLNLRVDNDDRIALLGSNGNGKSTLVKLLAGKLEPMHGSVTRAANLKVAYFAQHQLDELNPEHSPYDHVRALMPDQPEAKVRAKVGAIGFSGQAGNTLVKSLSGGEKARLMLGLATFNAPHLIILDEPTNHLDIDSRARADRGDQRFPGRGGAGVARPLSAGGLRRPAVAGRRRPRHAVRRRSRRLSTPGAVGRKAGAAKPPPQIDRGDVRRAAAEKRAETAPLRKRVQEAELKIAQLTRQLGQARRHARRRQSVRNRSGPRGRAVENAGQRRRRDRAGGRGMAGGELGARDRLSGAIARRRVRRSTPTWRASSALFFGFAFGLSGCGAASTTFSRPDAKV